MVDSKDLQNNRIYILTEGGSQFGYGHITRCSALYEELEKRDINVEFIVNGDNDVSSVLEGKKFTLKDWRDKTYLSNLLFENDYVIIDSYLADKDIYDYIANIVRKALYIDDNIRIDYPKGIVCNPSIYGKELNYLKKEGLEYLLGAEYVILRKEFIDVPKKEFKDKIEDILITFGGSDIKNMTPKTLKILNENYPSLRKHVIVGKGFNNIDKIKSVSDENTEFYYNLNAEQMKNLMLKCDFAISAAGQTIYELLRVGIPFVPIQVADNQENNIKGLKALGIEKLGEDELFKTIQILENIKKTNYINNIINGKGSEKILDFLFTSCFIRKLKESDKINVFNLSNKKYVRKYSLNKNNIMWENHLNWFSNQLNNSNIIFYILENLNKDFLGQVKFEVDEYKKIALISISFDEKIKGRGVGKFILENSIIKFKEENKKIEIIKAVIHNENTPSYKLFKNLNFILNIKGEDFSEYIKKI